MKTPPVCFGARDNTFGSFVVPSSGKLVSVKLVHVYGYVTCDKRNRAYWSFWGCCHYPKDVNVVITTSFDKILLPSKEFLTGLVLKRSSIPGYNSLSPGTGTVGCLQSSKRGRRTGAPFVVRPRSGE